MSQQIANNIQEKYPTLEVEYSPTRGRVTVYGFHTLKGAATAARAELESMGFQLGPNNGTLKVEQILEDVKFEEMTEAQMKATQDYWSR